MKFLIAFLLLISLRSQSQTFNPSDFSFEFKEQAPSLSKQQIFSKIKVALGEIYPSFKSVVEVEDTLLGVILLKPSFTVAVGQGMSLQKIKGKVAYTLKVSVSDHDYKISLRDFNHSSVEDITAIEVRRRADIASGGNVADDKPDCGWSKISKKGWQAIKEESKNEANSIALKINQSIANN